MKKEFIPMYGKIAIIMIFAAILFSLTPQARQVLAAENASPVAFSFDRIGTVSKAATQYRDIQLAGQLIALIAGVGFLLLAVAPYILLREQE